MKEPKYIHKTVSKNPKIKNKYLYITDIELYKGDLYRVTYLSYTSLGKEKDYYGKPTNYDYRPTTTLLTKDELLYNFDFDITTYNNLKEEKTMKRNIKEDIFARRYYEKKDEAKGRKGSKMYDRGYNYDSSMDYIPDWKDEQEKADWTLGFKDANKKKENFIKESDFLEYNWIAVSRDGARKREYILFGFNTEKQADKAIERIENISDITIFSVDNYGYTSEIEVIDYFEKRGEVVSIRKLSRVDIKKIFSLLKNLNERSRKNKQKKRFSEEYERRFIEKSRIDDDDRIKALAQHLELDEEEAMDTISVSRYDDNLLEYGKREYYVLTEDEADDKFIEYEKNLWDDMGLEFCLSSFRDWIMSNALDEDKFWDDYRYDITYPIESNPDEEAYLFDEDELKEFLQEYVEKISKDNRKQDIKLIKQALEELDVFPLEEIDPKEFIQFDFDYLSRSFTETFYDYLNITDKELQEETEKSLISKLDEYYEQFINEIENADIENVLRVIYSLNEIDRFIDDAVDNFIKLFDSPYNYLSEKGGSDSDIGKELEKYIDLNVVFEEIKDQDGRASLFAGYDGNEYEESVDGEDFYIYRYT
jgi:hypothetical protein